MVAEKKNTQELSFEESLKKLESLLEDMEGGEVPLTKLVEKFEQGSLLLRQCQKRLGEAELRIEKLKTSDEELVLEPVAQD